MGKPLGMLMEEFRFFSFFFFFPANKNVDIMLIFCWTWKILLQISSSSVFCYFVWLLFTWTWLSHPMCLAYTYKYQFVTCQCGLWNATFLCAFSVGPCSVLFSNSYSPFIRFMYSYDRMLLPNSPPFSHHLPSFAFKSLMLMFSGIVCYLYCYLGLSHYVCSQHSWQVLDLNRGIWMLN